MKKTLITIIYLFTGISLFAQGGFPPPPPPPPPSNGGPNCWPPPCVPIDNGMLFLALAGTGLVFYKLYSMNKDKKTA